MNNIVNTLQSLGLIILAFVMLEVTKTLKFVLKTLRDVLEELKPKEE